MFVHFASTLSGCADKRLCSMISIAGCNRSGLAVERRTDVVIHYRGKRYIIEMKIWHGESRNEEGEKQIIGYQDSFESKTGYMLSFSFNRNKEPGVHEVRIGDRLLFEGVV